MTTSKKRGGWSNPASAENGKAGGRKRSPAQKIRGEDAFVLRSGDEVAVIDAGGSHIARVEIVDGALKLVNDQGLALTIILAE